MQFFSAAHHKLIDGFCLIYLENFSTDYVTINRYIHRYVFMLPWQIYNHGEYGEIYKREWEFFCKPYANTAGLFATSYLDSGIGAFTAVHGRYKCIFTYGTGYFYLQGTSMIY